jgi:hypothetical protein
MAAPKETAKLNVVSGYSSQLDSIGTRYSSAASVITNPRKTEAACDVSVTFNLKDATGGVMDTQTADVPWIPAGGRVLVAPLQIGFEAKTAPSGLGVTTIVDHYAATKDISGCGGFSINNGIPMQVVSAAIENDQYGDRTVKGQVKNPTKEVVKDPSVTCVYRGRGALLGGTATSIMDPIPPGGTIAFEPATSSDIPKDADSVECQVTA